MKTVTYILPSNWLTYFFYGDETGLTDEESRAVHSIERELLKDGYSACAIDTGDDKGFLKYHEAIGVYPYACDCIEIIFPEIA